MKHTVFVLLLGFSNLVPLVHGTEIFPTNATWRLFRGRTEASSPDLTAWRYAGFNDAAFSNAPAPFTYGEGYGYGTDVADMQNQYACIFLRRAFEITNAAAIAALRLGAKVDDGFVAWINGTEVKRVNMPDPPGSPVTITNLANGATEPVPFVFYDLLLSPTNFLVNGTNLIAIQVFNVNLPSSDLVFDCSLEAILADAIPPAVADFSPRPGTITNLTQITVTFTEPVSGVNADDLLISGASASAVSGRGSNYTFTFAQPAYGGVYVSWAPNHAIVDLALPPNPFNAEGPGATWSYHLIDIVPPTVVNVFPPAGATVVSLGQIEVTFSEDVANVAAADLLINQQPATNLIVRPGAVYLFQFPPPATGTVQIAWAAGHGITDLALPPNPFVGSPWTCTFDPNAPPAQLVITEISAANQTGLTDEDGDQEDWIEIQNRGVASADLAGWSLSDDPELPSQWVFPPRILNAGEFLVVFASGKDRRAPTGTNRFHTSFLLAASGEFLGLYSADSPRQLVSGFSPQFPEQRNDISFGLDPQGNWRYFDTPTPGASNGVSTLVGLVAPVHCSVARGHFTQPFTLALTTPTPGAQIRYTANGTEPTLTNGLPYLKPLQVSNTMLLRAAAFRAGYVPSTIGTHSYLFNLSAAYRALPVISIVTDQNNLTGPRGIIGISNVVQQGDGTYVPRDATGYHNPSLHGIAWERPTSVEWIQPGDNSGFQANCGIRVQGSDYQRPRTTTASKFSFRLYFRGDYGLGQLDYPLFPLTSVREFDQLVLRAGFNEQGSPFIRDELTRRLSHDMGEVASHGSFAIVLLNGAVAPVSPYYNPCERVHEEMLQAHLGGSQDWDVVAPTFAQGSGPPGVVDGDRADFQSLVNFINSQAVTNPSVYLEAARRLDLTNFVDYLLLNVYCAMGDWPQNNWRAGKDRGPGGIWRFIVWDGEWAMGIYGRGVTTNMFTNNGPGPNAGGLASTDSEIAQMYTRLYANPEFRLLWADRIHKQMFNGGALMDTNIIARFTQMQTNLLSVIPSMATDILTTWVPQRRGIVFDHFNQFGLLASSNAPFFNQHGGRVPRGFALTMTATNVGGTIYFTTNGEDPRVMFTGAIASNAVTYPGPLTLNQSMTVRARTLLNGKWSASAEATFDVGLIGVPVRFTEIHYHPIEGNSCEFLELQNVGSAPADLSGMSFDGVTFRFPEGTLLAPGAVLVLASEANPSVFAARFPGVTVAGWFSGALNNGGERIALLDRYGSIVTSVTYGDSGGWPTAADGGGPSLEVMDPLGDADDPANWRASAQAGGTPGVPPTPTPLPIVRLNEVMADNLSAVNFAGAYPDWIELYNAGGGSVDLAGWSLSDDGSVGKFVFPSNTTLAAAGYLIVWCDAPTNVVPGLHCGFALERSGGHVYLFDAASNRVDALGYGQQLANFCVGRVGSQWVLATPTASATNVAAALAAPGNLSINEWMANPPPGQSDWLELHNRSLTQPAALRGLFLATSNATHQITSLSFVAPGSHALLWTDEGVGPDHLRFKLPAVGGLISLYDSAGVLLNSVSYTAQTEGVSRGRYPDGTTTLVNFPGTASPGTTNYVAGYTGPVLNEVLARNLTAVTNAGHVADFVELYNPNAASFNVGGMSLAVDAPEAGQWFFPPNTTIPGRGFLLVWCDGSRPAATNAGNFNTGRSLNGDSGGAYLFNASGQLVNSVEYGFQVADLSLGLVSGQWRLLTAPTPGATNSAPAPLGANTALRFNEWMANPARGPDWFELFNATNLPVDLAGLVLTDDPSTAGTNKFIVAPLSFIGPSGFVKWVADADPGQGRHHVNFNLEAEGEMLRLYASNATAILDSISFGAKRSGVSEGRWPDGGANFSTFAGSPSPGEANYFLLPGVVINELLTHASPPLEDAVELRNLTDQPLSIGGWYLSDSQREFRKYRIPAGTILPSGGFAVFYENQFSNGSPTSFTLSGAHGGELWLSEADGAGNLSGARVGAKFGAAAAGVAFGRHVTRLDTDYVALERRSFGTDSPATLGEFRTGTGASNAPPRVGPVVIDEIMYNPPPTTGGVDFEEYIELRSITNDTVRLFDPTFPTNTWRVSGGVQFAFPPGATLAAGGRLLLVPFDPAANLSALANFRAAYGVPAEVPVLGPYAGKLDNAGDTVELLQPDTPQPPSAPDAGFVPWVRVDKVEFGDAPPWPAGATDGGGLSLSRRESTRYGDDPENWIATAPTPGTANGAAVVAPPVITQSPRGQIVVPGGSARFDAAASGGGPLGLQWRLNGVPLRGQTNASLLLDYAALEDEGSYDVFVSNPGGSTFSEGALLLVNAAPVIVEAPQSRNVSASNSVTFTVLATGTQPLRYQWRFNGVDIPGAVGTSLTVTNINLPQVGNYTVVVSNRVGTAEATAALAVLIRPVFTTQPISQAVVPGVPVAFSAIWNGMVPGGHRWRRESTNIVLLPPLETLTVVPFAWGYVIGSPTSSVLVLTNASVTVTGRYSVVASNAAGVLASANATLTLLTDTDGDGLPDSWESGRAGFSATDPADGARDDDGDGMSNAAEWLAGTDYLDPASCLKVELRLASGARISFQAVSNRAYGVQFTDGLEPPHWLRLAIVPAQTNTRPVSIPDPAAGTNRFYRLILPVAP